ncbi:hypothetical protein [Streptomyces marispadix]|uniref:Integral membrane protein n=1 Tax=Streptomyces marispadix TaxID=2922868 RepID=A0ABS9SY16_9ACTN|nr:hypothetical protein [Streptomyces marispadix]MCH6160971.1 hypothetical protein [Streptomyces marispadix]
MGIESDKLVFDYLSRIGDLAHSTPMTAAERARLVTGLRGEIDRMRAEEGGAESKAAVKKILARLGKPEEVVAARGSGSSGGSGTSGDAGGSGASGGFSGSSEAPAAGGEGRYVHRPSGEGSSGSESGGDRLVKRPKISLRKRPPEPAPPPASTASYGAGAPHLAGMDELGPEESDPDWWRVDPTPYGDGGGSRTFGEPVPGFVGGIELPELLKPPPGGGEEDAAQPGGSRPRSTVPAARKAPDDERGEGAPGEGAAGDGAAGRARRLLPGRARVGTSGPRVGGVVELAAAAVLAGGAVAGSLIALGVGWLAAWWSPRLSRTEAKWAAAGMPGLVAAGTALWLWGRTEGRWGEPIAQGGKELGRALTEAGPVVLRVAAVASALFLVWRARRPKP